jgi:hypothetical protein
VASILNCPVHGLDSGVHLSLLTRRAGAPGDVRRRWEREAEEKDQRVAVVAE